MNLNPDDFCLVVFLRDGVMSDFMSIESKSPEQLKAQMGSFVFDTVFNETDEQKDDLLEMAKILEKSPEEFSDKDLQIFNQVMAKYKDKYAEHLTLLYKDRGGREELDFFKINNLEYEKSRSIVEQTKEEWKKQLWQNEEDVCRMRYERAKERYGENARDKGEFVSTFTIDNHPVRSPEELPIGQMPTANHKMWMSQCVVDGYVANGQDGFVVKKIIDGKETAIKIFYSHENSSSTNFDKKEHALLNFCSQVWSMRQAYGLPHIPQLKSFSLKDMAMLYEYVPNDQKPKTYSRECINEFVKTILAISEKNIFVDTDVSSDNFLYDAKNDCINLIDFKWDPWNSSDLGIYNKGDLEYSTLFQNIILCIRIIVRGDDPEKNISQLKLYLSGVFREIIKKIDVDTIKLLIEYLVKNISSGSWVNVGLKDISPEKKLAWLNGLLEQA